ncbi:MAG: hypothetical protein QME92_07385 [Bacillota bacterium]|nr:hypothetical protein [Bacillota bacterium]
MTLHMSLPCIIGLVEEGLVVLAPRVGYYVVELSPEDVEEISDIREMIELHAVRRAMKETRPSEIRTLLNETRALKSLGDDERRKVAMQRVLPGETEVAAAMRMIEEVCGRNFRYCDIICADALYALACIVVNLMLLFIYKHLKVQAS